MSNKIFSGYKHKGYEYTQYRDTDEECVKIFHEVMTPDGRKLDFDWSPYTTPSVEEFQVFVDLGCPNRVGNGPLTKSDLLSLLTGFENG